MILGTLLFFVVGGFVKNTVGLYLIHNADTATFIGVIAGLWAAWPCYHRAWLARRNFLHPPVRRYKLPIKQAFASVRQVLSNSTYNYGDKWHISFADTMQRRISASLRFTDDEFRMEGHSVSRMYMRKERKQRLLELEVQFEGEPGGITLIQFDFHPKVEGIALHACDRIIYLMRNDLLEVLGPGEAIVDEGAKPVNLTPPWWLIAVTVLGLINFSGAAMDHLGQTTQKLQEAPKELQREKAEQDQSEQNMRDEIAAWKNFKERYNVR
jgi:hypothetical protein